MGVCKGKEVMWIVATCNETLGEGRQYLKRVLKIIVFAM